MPMDIEEFCQLISKEYTYYLYEYFNIKKGTKGNNEFPFCCHASSNLIASYLHEHFDKSFIHKKMPAHGVAISDSCIVDFTEFQFRLKDEAFTEIAERLKDPSRPFSKAEIYNLVQLEPIYQTSESAHFRVCYDFPLRERDKCELFALEYAKMIENPYTLEGFMKYVEIAIEGVGYKVVAAGYY